MRPEHRAYIDALLLNADTERFPLPTEPTGVFPHDFLAKAPARLLMAAYLNHHLNHGSPCDSEFRWMVETLVKFIGRDIRRRTYHGPGVKLAAMESEVAEQHSYPWPHDTAGTYIGLYTLGLYYGGPEEGGWYYVNYEPVLAKRVDHLSGEEQLALVERIRRAAEASWDEGSYRNVNGGLTFTAWIQKGSPTYVNGYTPYE